MCSLEDLGRTRVTGLAPKNERDTVDRACSAAILIG
jgi:hypothetical protein